MQDLEAVKRSIRSAEDLSNVVRTMKTMAAVSIRQYETAAKSLSVYARTIDTGLSMLLRNQEDRPEHQPSAAGPTGAIVFGSDQGMCGQFNEQISQFASEQLETKNAAGVPVICVGHRIADKFSNHDAGLERIFRLPGSAPGITGLVHDLLPAIDDWRAIHKLSRIIVYHNRRLTSSSWQPHSQQLLPLHLDRLKQQGQSGSPGRSLAHWTMDTNRLFSRLVKQFLFVSLFQASAESMAGENASRIAAMQSAERNIGERLHELRSDYAQQRQTTITEELLDVVTGFEALRESSQQG